MSLTTGLTPVKEIMVDIEKIKKAVRDILEALGEDPRREGLEDTPARVAEMYQEIFSGLRQEPQELFQTSFTEPYEGTVLLKDIPYYSVCEHHLLPFFGTAHVAYIPSGRIAGASKLARLVDIFARRPQLQERLTTQIADAVMAGIKPQGVAVVVEGLHLCMIMRGVKKANARVVTSVTRGSFEGNPHARSELLALLPKP